TDLPDRAGKTRACLTAGPNQPEHKKTDTPCCSSTQSETPNQILDTQRNRPGEHQGTTPWQAANITFSF
ncbi:hypothetical protein, partial [Pseudomonas savastanoi]|uniref:hypothetical protein n=1 Tax=Pseudomonas savastanoi TaxID=29438 RepID=UPI001969AF70